MALGPESFRGARLKVQRAYRHIDEFQAALDAFTADQFYTLVTHKQADGFTISIVPLKPFPDLAMIVGDAVHNLRAALDHLATAVVRNGGGSGMDLFFPFHKEGKNLVTDTAKLNPIEKALPGAKRLIVDEIQPYQNGKGDHLYGLHQLDKLDKHNELIVTAAASLAGPLVADSANGGGGLAFARIRFNPKQETRIPITFPGDEPTLQHDYKATLDVSFGEALPLGGEPVFATLIDLAERITEIIDAFEGLIPT